MNRNAKLTLFTALNLIAGLFSGLGAQAAQPGVVPAEGHTALLPAGTNEFEASFLAVPMTCKSSHHHFQAERVVAEQVSAEILAIHSLLGVQVQSA